MRELANGDVVAAGAFTAVGVLTGAGIVRWNGTTWSSLGQPTVPFSNGGINTMVELPNGDLVVGGFFTHVSGVAANYVARWDGAAWHALGAGSTWIVTKLATLPNGDVVAIGAFPVAGGGTVRVARWDGLQWQPLGPGTLATGNALAVMPNGDVVVFDGAGFWSWSGGAWSPFATWTGNNDINRLLADAGGGFYVGGIFERAVSIGALGIAHWNGSQWQTVANGTDQPLRVLAAGPGGTFAAGGLFTSIEGVPAQHLAFFDGTSWVAAGNGALGPIIDVAVRANGELLAMGDFAGGGALTVEVRSWLGGALTPVGPPGTWTTNSPWALAPARNGDCWIAYGQGFLGPLGLARWNGTNLTLQSLGLPASVEQILELPNGDVALVGIFNLPTGTTYLVRWDGATLQPFGTGTNSYVRAVGLLRNGDLVAAGNFTQPGNHIARWDGVAWHPVGTGLTGFPSSLVVLPDDSLLVDEVMGPAGATTSRLMHWNGSQWTLRAQLDGSNALLALTDIATLGIGGGNHGVAGLVSPFIARFASNCPASASAAGVGCSGSAGPIVLTIDELAWLGGELRTTTTGLAPGALAVSVYGLAPLALPMPSVHPLGQPGCWLYSDDDLLLQFTVNGAELHSQLPVPNTTMLIGASFYHQVVPVEVNGAGDITALVSSNAVVLVIGAL